ncbi:MAG TPA: SMC-Scp complex subunit ScpB [Terracidiphilus sp.]|jgi:segregation and condensation protein B|nr:SMC-Scp complex subunit ScpB [Terracidiphilus sp.]
MSLKSKLEAVIYASEEPVTLAQLASLFAVEALEWKAEQEAAAAAAAEEAESIQEPEPLPLTAEASEASEPVELALAASAESEGTAASTEASAEITSAEAAPEVDPEAEAKKQAKQRDREVRAIVRQLLDEIIASYASDDRGVEIREIAGGYRMATKPACHDAVRLFIKSLKPPLKLSLPALETLAVIAYKQPVTAPEVSDIRGVESAGVLGSLMSRKLITTAGRKQVIGRPILYKTTKEFLLRFGLKDISELPSMEEFEKIAAVELAEASEETESGFEHVQSAGKELDPDAPETDGSGDTVSAEAAVTSTEATGSAPAEPAIASDSEHQSAETEPQPEAETVSHD